MGRRLSLFPGSFPRSRTHRRMGHEHPAPAPVRRQLQDTWDGWGSRHGEQEIR